MKIVSKNTEETIIFEKMKSRDKKLMYEKTLKYVSPYSKVQTDYYFKYSYLIFHIMENLIVDSEDNISSASLIDIIPPETEYLLVVNDVIIEYDNPICHIHKVIEINNELKLTNVRNISKKNPNLINYIKSLTN